MEAQLNYKQETIQELAAGIVKQGYRVFIAGSGEYGLYSDKEYSRVISFQLDYFRPTAGGNYKTSNPGSTGTGWRISNDFKAEDAENVFNAYPPSWALKDANFEYTTLDEHLKTYLASSKYVEFLLE